MLRNRLLFNLIPFVVILLAVGIYAIALFSHLAGSVDVTIMQNYRSELAAQDMSLALSRLENGVVLVLNREEFSGRSTLDENLARFEDQLELQRNNVSSIKERELTRGIEQDYLSLRNLLINFFQERDPQLRRRIANHEIHPKLFGMNLLLKDLRNHNHDQMLQTTEKVNHISSDVTRLMVVGILIALTISSYACYQLARSILQPIESLTAATRAVGEGNLDQTVPVVSRDELSVLAGAFNKMAAQLREYRQTTDQEILKLHHTRETTLASFPDPIYVLDPQGNVELRNPAAAELSRRLQLDGELPPRLHELIREVIEKGADYLPNDFQKVISLRPGGEDLHFLPRILLMHGREGRLLGVAAVLYNVTRFRLLDDAKSNLVATVSHEIKTPLTSIRMVLHLLLEKAVGPLNPKQLDLVTAAHKDSERLLRILNDLLDLTRLEQGNTGLNRETTPADVLLRHAVEPLEELIKARGLHLHCETEPSLPAVSVDVQRIEHVFSNLITNAGKHSPKHGKIIVSASHGEDGGVRFSVRDQGPGIPPEFQNRVFERFFRVPGQTKSGAGLGLSICREIVIAHGGRIGFKPLPKGGSEFYFVLPEASEHPPG